jgi:hypothetical protein
VDIRGRPRTVFVLGGGVLSTEFMPDTEEVTGSIPVSPTSSKNGSDLRERRPEPVCIEPCTDLISVEWCPYLTNYLTTGGRRRR